MELIELKELTASKCVLSDSFEEVKIFLIINQRGTYSSVVRESEFKPEDPGVRSPGRAG